MTPGINVQIDPEEVQRAVVAAVVQAGIGKIIAEEVEKELKGSYQYDSAIKRAVRQQVSITAANLIRDEYSEKIRDAVRELMTDDIVKAITGAAWNAYFQELDRK